MFILSTPFSNTVPTKNEQTEKLYNKGNKHQKFLAIRAIYV